MAKTEELDRDLRAFVQMYAWQHIDPVPWTEPAKPLSESRVGLVVNACMTLPNQPPFHAEEPDFDASIRIIPANTDPQTLVNTYPGQAFDHEGLQADANLLVPIDRLHEMADRGEIGDLGPHVISLCGHLPKPQHLIEDTAPAIARIFEEDRVDVALLVPA